LNTAVALTRGTDRLNDGSSVSLDDSEKDDDSELDTLTLGVPVSDPVMESVGLGVTEPEGVGVFVPYVTETVTLGVCESNDEVTSLLSDDVTESDGDAPSFETDDEGDPESLDE
jgi:hypothetical protein